MNKVKRNSVRERERDREIDRETLKCNRERERIHEEGIIIIEW